MYFIFHLFIFSLFLTLTDSSHFHACYSSRARFPRFFFPSFLPSIYIPFAPPHVSFSSTQCPSDIILSFFTSHCILIHSHWIHLQLQQFSPPSSPAISFALPFPLNSLMYILSQIAILCLQSHSYTASPRFLPPCHPVYRSNQQYHAVCLGLYLNSPPNTLIQLALPPVLFLSAPHSSTSSTHFYTSFLIPSSFCVSFSAGGDVFTLPQPLFVKILSPLPDTALSEAQRPLLIVPPRDSLRKSRVRDGMSRKEGELG